MQLWEKRVGTTRYEVRKAGHSLRLYTNGTFHTQYSPKHLFSGGVWDLLTLPALYRTVLPQSILMLGVGGGAAIHQLLQIAQPRELVGVELDAEHLYVARHFFEVTDPRVRLVHRNAVAFLKGSRRRFDLIVDDLFLDGRDDPVRPVAPGVAWFRQLASHLTPTGMIIQNHLSHAEAKLAVAHALEAGTEVRTALIFQTPTYANRVLALYPETIDSGAGRKLLWSRIPDPYRRKLRFTARQLTLPAANLRQR